MKNCLVNATVIKFSNEEILRCCFSEDSEKGVQCILLLVQSICGVLVAVIIADAFFMRAGAQKKNIRTNKSPRPCGEQHVSAKQHVKITKFRSLTST